jgi:ABC-type antimicrobial peptide transport system permease subunit
MTVMVSNSLVAQSLASSVMRVFGFVALVLSSLGLYGVLAYLIGQRTQEIGVRVALGATRSDVLRLVVGQSLRLVATGVALGLGLAAGASQALASLLYGVGTLDPLTYVAAATAILVVGLAATVVPARRALAVDPVVALRTE